MAIQAIETAYAGCRFRSRLEARWAVFFDTLGIEWQYESEGIKIQQGESTSLYLPDFWLPRQRTHVEVKGTDPTQDYLEMLSWGIDYHGPLADGLLLLGPIPDVTRASIVLHAHLRWHEGVQFGLVAFTKSGGLYPYNGIGGEEDGTTAPEWPRGATWAPRVLRVEVDGRGSYRIPSTIQDAYTAARSARFEHGETPIPPRRQPTLGSVTRSRSAQAARDALSSARVVIQHKAKDPG